MIDPVDVENRIRIWCDADAVVELFDNWEGMNIVSVRFGNSDGSGGVEWSGGEHALAWDMVRGLAQQLNKLADAYEERKAQ